MESQPSNTVPVFNDEEPETVVMVQAESGDLEDGSMERLKQEREALLKEVSTYRANEDLLKAQVASLQRDKKELEDKISKLQAKPFQEPPTIMYRTQDNTADEAATNQMRLRIRLALLVAFVLVVILSALFFKVVAES